MYDRKDHFYKKAKEEGRVSRASYKLEQIQARYKIIKKGDIVLDLGCAPGSWLEVIADMVGQKGMVIGVDILPLHINLRNNIKFILGDIYDEGVLKDIKEVDVVVSDMAPNTSGVAFRDAYLSYELCMLALEAAQKHLKKGGNFVCKIFQGKETEDLKKALRKNFTKVHAYVPPATRQTSKEFYLVATGIIS